MLNFKNNINFDSCAFYKLKLHNFMFKDRPNCCVLTSVFLLSDRTVYPVILHRTNKLFAGLICHLVLFAVIKTGCVCRGEKFIKSVQDIALIDWHQTIGFMHDLHIVTSFCFSA